MRHLVSGWVALLFLLGLCFGAGGAEIDLGGRLALAGLEGDAWWALSSAAKVRPDTPAPPKSSAAVLLRSARNEWESAQLVVRPARGWHQVTVQAGSLVGPGQQIIAATNLEILQAVYLDVKTATDSHTTTGWWPDPLVPLRGTVDLPAGTNQSFWLRIHVDPQTPAGTYRSRLRITAKEGRAEVPVELTVYDFALPDRMTCQTAFGFSPGTVFHYQRLTNEVSRRQVLDKYWADLAAHHISPYDPAPLDPVKVTWPRVQPPRKEDAGWRNRRIVQNERHGGKGALLVYDDRVNETVTASYDPLIPIPPKGLRLRGWYRTAVPGHRFMVSLNHYDAKQEWMSGLNRDVTMVGNGEWQSADFLLNEFPPGARFVRLNLMATIWTEAGEKVGLVWFDDLSIQNAGTGEELVQGGDFEPTVRTELCAPAEQLQAELDFAAWDQAMAKAFDQYHFNAFSVHIPGLGGGTFHELAQPSLLGFGEDEPEYPLLLGSYCHQMEGHLRTKGWLEQSYIYWFDEPSADQYSYLQNGFNKLKEFCPQIPRMITKLVEPGLIGGPNLWCPISDQFNWDRARERQQLDERFWWYVCTGPKAPYAGLFLDRSAPELRVWLWQTFQRNIQGILIWQCNYWTSDTAYPEPGAPQNPYVDPMSWMTGYGTPKGKKLPWGNGDGRFIYPPADAAGHSGGPVLDGPVDSIRWEHLRDGIEDYEYLSILKRKLNQRRSSLDAAAVQRYEQLLTVPESITRSMTEFTPDGRPIELRRDQIARAIEAL